MKRLNYYQVHKNKKPKRLKKPHRKLSHIPLIAVIMATTAVNIAFIQTSPFLDLISKRLNMLNTVVDAAFAIVDVIDKINNQNPKKLYYESRFQKSSSSC